MLDPERDHERRQIARNTDRKRAADAEGREQDAADDRTEHTARIVGPDIERHRGAHSLVADDLPDHRAAHRVVSRPGDAADKAGECQMPDFERAGPGEQCQDDRAQQHREDDKDECRAPFHALRRGAD